MNNTDKELKDAALIERYHGRETAERYLSACRNDRSMGNHPGFIDGFLVGKVPESRS